MPAFFHGGKFSFGNSQLVRVQGAGFGKNGLARVSEKMVAHRMMRWRGGETIGKRECLEILGAGQRHTLEGRVGLHVEKRTLAGRRTMILLENPERNC